MDWTPYAFLFDVELVVKSTRFVALLNQLGTDKISIQFPAIVRENSLPNEGEGQLTLYLSRRVIIQQKVNFSHPIGESGLDPFTCLTLSQQVSQDFIHELEREVIEEVESMRTGIPGKLNCPQFAFPDKIPFRKSYQPEDLISQKEWISRQVGILTPNLGNHHFHTPLLRGNIEHFIGAVQIPVGLAGPFYIKGHHAKGYFYLPIATTEGALVASISRGAYVASLGGGITVSILKQQMIRAPQFNFNSTTGAVRFQNWLIKNFQQIQKEAEKYSQRAKLIFLEPYVLGKACHVRFCYTTGDAAGQNMSTVCTHGCCKLIADLLAKDPSFEFQNFILEGNFAGDKKVNAYNFIHGRGVSVVAETFIPTKIFQRHLRINPEQMVHGMTQSLHGATASGQIGNTANFANVIAGVFTACGQDIACVHESSSGQLFFEAHPEGFYMGIRIPNLVIGTVGGGTALPAQKECLKLLGCYGSGKVGRLAEIIGAACLALDLSTCAALVEDTFAQAHDSLGRNRPIDAD